MKIAEIRTLYAYNRWANKLMLTMAAQVSEGQFVEPAAFSYGSLRGVLFHTFEAEYFWRVLCQEGRFVEELVEADYPTLAVLEPQWQAEEAAMGEYLARLRDEDMDGLVRYTVEGGIQRERLLWHCLWHVVNHGTQHRSEAAAILTNYGFSPGGVDFTLFLNEQVVRG